MYVHVPIRHDLSSPIYIHGIYPLKGLVFREGRMIFSVSKERRMIVSLLNESLGKGWMILTLSKERSIYHGGNWGSHHENALAPVLPLLYHYLSLDPYHQLEVFPMVHGASFHHQEFHTQCTHSPIQAQRKRMYQEGVHIHITLILASWYM